MYSVTKDIGITRYNKIWWRRWKRRSSELDPKSADTRHTRPQWMAQKQHWTHREGNRGLEKWLCREKQSKANGFAYTVTRSWGPFFVFFPPQVKWNYCQVTEKLNKTAAQLVKNPPAMCETWVQSLGWEEPLEKGKLTHSSIQAWRIPWIVEFRGSQRVGHDWLTFTLTHTQRIEWKCYQCGPGRTSREVGAERKWLQSRKAEFQDSRQQK